MGEPSTYLDALSTAVHSGQFPIHCTIRLRQPRQRKGDPRWNPALAEVQRDQIALELAELGICGLYALSFASITGACVPHVHAILSESHPRRTGFNAIAINTAQSTPSTSARLSTAQTDRTPSTTLPVKRSRSLDAVRRFRRGQSLHWMTTRLKKPPAQVVRSREVVKELDRLRPLVLVLSSSMRSTVHAHRPGALNRRSRSYQSQQRTASTEKENHINSRPYQHCPTPHNSRPRRGLKRATRRPRRPPACLFPRLGFDLLETE